MELLLFCVKNRHAKQLTMETGSGSKQLKIRSMCKQGIAGGIVDDLNFKYAI